jgi:hypothetical protein
LRQLLSSDGIGSVSPLIAPDQLARLNALLDPLFAERANERRAYVTVDELWKMGAFEIVFSPKIQDLFLAIMPDPVFYHFHLYEIAGQATQSHIFSEALSGWHRDPDSDYVAQDVTHVSLFIYLSEVGPEDGPFQFLPGDPTRLMTGATPTISVEGAPGFSFLWHRSFYHRAAPNRGPRRRRLIKISVQRNAYPSVHLQRDAFRALDAAIPPGDPRMDMFLGRMQGRDAPPLPAVPDVMAERLIPNNAINVPTIDIMKAQLKGKARSLRQMFRPAPATRVQETAAYD